VRRISENSAGDEGNANSSAPALSSDGQIVSYYSGATNLADAQSGQVWSLLEYDIVTNETRMLTEGAIGLPGSYVPSMTADGAQTAFLSEGTNLVEGDDNGLLDVYVGQFR